MRRIACHYDGARARAIIAKIVVGQHVDVDGAVLVGGCVVILGIGLIVCTNLELVTLHLAGTTAGTCWRVAGGLSVSETRISRSGLRIGRHGQCKVIAALTRCRDLLVTDDPFTRIGEVAITVPIEPGIEIAAITGLIVYIDGRVIAGSRGQRDPFQGVPSYLNGPFVIIVWVVCGVCIICTSGRRIGRLCIGRQPGSKNILGRCFDASLSIGYRYIAVIICVIEDSFEFVESQRKKKTPVSINRIVLITEIDPAGILEYGAAKALGVCVATDLLWTPSFILYIVCFARRKTGSTIGRIAALRECNLRTFSEKWLAVLVQIQVNIISTNTCIGGAVQIQKTDQQAVNSNRGVGSCLDNSGNEFSVNAGTRGKSIVHFVLEQAAAYIRTRIGSPVVVLRGNLDEQIKGGAIVGLIGSESICGDIAVGSGFDAEARDTNVNSGRYRDKSSPKHQSQTYPSNHSHTLSLQAMATMALISTFSRGFSPRSCMFSMLAWHTPPSTADDSLSNGMLNKDVNCKATVFHALRSLNDTDSLPS